MYINTITKEYPVSSIRVANTSVSKNPSAAFLLEYGYASVAESPRPHNIRGRIITEMSPELIKGVYTQTWGIDDTNVDPMQDLRVIRDKRLSSSDYTQAADTTQTVTDKALWATYRQELRDLPATYADNPEDVVWPIAPDSSATAIL